MSIVVRSDVTVGGLKEQLHRELLEGRHDNVVYPPSTPSTTRRGEGNKWEGTGLPPSCQRVFFLGRLLPDDFTVQECALTGSAFVQVFVTAPP